MSIWKLNVPCRKVPENVEQYGRQNKPLLTLHYHTVNRRTSLLMLQSAAARDLGQSHSVQRRALSQRENSQLYIHTPLPRPRRRGAAAAGPTGPLSVNRLSRRRSGGGGFQKLLLNLVSVASAPQFVSAFVCHTQCYCRSHQRRVL